ncbi:MAG: septation protein SpoVG family protein [Candidatus Brocadiia bacterium]
MEITEVRVKLLRGRSDRLRSFCSITIDDEFVVHDLRVIDGRKGMFVAMPSRKLSDNCPKCGGKNHLRAKYCNDCGAKLDPDRAKGRDKYHVDVAHPIVTPCREKIQERVLTAYKEELEAKKRAEEEEEETETVVSDEPESTEPVEQKEEPEEVEEYEEEAVEFEPDDTEEAESETLEEPVPSQESEELSSPEEIESEPPPFPGSEDEQEIQEDTEEHEETDSQFEAETLEKPEEEDVGEEESSGFGDGIF